MIEAWVALAQWDYMVVVVDGGMTPVYWDHLVTYPFPWFIDPIGMG